VIVSGGGGVSLLSSFSALHTDTPSVSHMCVPDMRVPCVCQLCVNVCVSTPSLLSFEQACAQCFERLVTAILPADFFARPHTVMLLLNISVYIQSMFSVKVSLN
jgi:hypothetical protein